MTNIVIDAFRGLLFYVLILGSGFGWGYLLGFGSLGHNREFTALLLGGCLLGLIIFTILAYLFRDIQ